MWWMALLGGLINIAGSLVGKVFLGLGLSVVTYTGLSSSIDFLKNGFVSSVSGLPVEVVGMLSLMKVGSCVSMVLSAITVKLMLDGLQSDTLKKWVK